MSHGRVENGPVIRVPACDLDGTNLLPGGLNGCHAGSFLSASVEKTHIYIYDRLVLANNGIFSPVGTLCNIVRYL